MLKRLAVRYLRPWLDTKIYRVRRGLARGLLRKGGFGFVPGRSANAEERFLLGLELAGQTVYDIGGWEGVFTMFFCRAVGPHGQVLTFEPNPANRARLLENLRLNCLTNARVFPLALGRTQARTTMAVDARESGRGSLRPDLVGSLAAMGAQPIEVSVVSLDELRLDEQLPPPHFVKMDIEGMELEALAGMRATLERHAPQLFIETHAGAGASAGTAPGVVRWLSELGYRLTWVEADVAIDADQPDLPDGIHIFARR
jgi:FkbM family methyltransferase